MLDTAFGDEQLSKFVFIPVSIISFVSLLYPINVVSSTVFKRIGDIYVELGVIVFMILLLAFNTIEFSPCVLLVYCPTLIFVDLIFRNC